MVSNDDIGAKVVQAETEMNSTSGEDILDSYGYYKDTQAYNIVGAWIIGGGIGFDAPAVVVGGLALICASLYERHKTRRATYDEAMMDYLQNGRFTKLDEKNEE